MEGKEDNSSSKYEARFACKQCPKYFVTKKSLSKHKRTIHPQAINITNCKRCAMCSNLEFANNRDYDQHFIDSHTSKDSGNYVCKECGKECRMRRSLIMHTTSKCGALKLFKCDVCNKEFKTSASLHNHMLRHKGSPNFMCRFCAKLFITMGQLEIHERIHTQVKPFACDVCGKSFRHRQSLVTHSTIHTGIKPFNCENCKRSFSCVGNLIKHRNTHATCARLPLTTHTTQNPSTKSKLHANTPKNCRLKHVLKEKIKEATPEVEMISKLGLTEVNPTNQRNVQANATTLSASEYSEKTNLVREGSLEKLDSFQNKPCSERSTTLAKTVQNVLTVSSEDCLTGIFNNDATENRSHKKCDVNEANIAAPDVNDGNIEDQLENKPVSSKIPAGDMSNQTKELQNKIYNIDNNGHLCNNCKKSFETKEEYQQHQMKDHPEMLTCTNCDKIYSTESSLKTHQNTFHLGIPRKVYNYICPCCGKQFKQKTSLTTHEKNNCNTILAFQCEVCDKSFATVYSRKAHMRIHSAKKLLCNYCGKRFHWKSQLKIHERSHTGDKPFSCPYCPAAFAYRESLITHSSVHTGIKAHMCEACGSRFSCIGNLIKHRTTHASTCGIYNKIQSKSEVMYNV